MQTEILTGAQSKRARDELGLSQQQVANKSRLSRTKISWLEGKKFTPDDEFVRHLRSFYEEQGVDFSHDEPEVVTPAPEPEPAPEPAAEDKPDPEPADEVNRKRREQAQPPAAKDGRYNNYRGGIRIAPHLGQKMVEAIFDRIDANNRRIEQLRQKEAGPGVDEAGFFPFGKGQLHLEGADRKVADELMHRTAANYVLVRVLQGDATFEPFKLDELDIVRKPWKADSHDELLRALVHPYAYGEPDEPAEDEADEDAEDEEVQERASGLLL